MEQVRIQVKFTENTPYGEYTDALYFSESEYANMSREILDAAKQQRIDNWIAMITRENNGE